MAALPPTDALPPAIPLGNVLVTGGAGFLGWHIIAQLLQRHTAPTTKISVLDIREPLKPHPGVKYYAGNLVNVEEVRKILQQVKPNVIIHSASPPLRHNGDIAAARRFLRKVNVEGTATLLEEAKKVGCRSFVYTSSASVISDAHNPVYNGDERWSIVPEQAQGEYYSATKAEAEQLVLARSTRQPAKSPFLTCAVRPCAMFGEYDAQLVPRMLDVLRGGRKTKYQLGDNENLWDFTYVGNAGLAHILAAEQLHRTAIGLEEGTVSALASSSSPEDAAAAAAAKVDGEAFIVTNHAPIYFWDFTRALWQTYYLHATKKAAENSAYAALVPKPPPGLDAVWELPGELITSFFRAYERVLAWLRLPGPTPTAQEMRFAFITRYFKARKAADRLGYRPRYDMGDGIQNTVEYFWGVEAAKLDAVAVGAKQ